jgi:hypothetical protein
MGVTGSLGESRMNLPLVIFLYRRPQLVRDLFAALQAYDILHYSNPSISSCVLKINYFSVLFLNSPLKKRSHWVQVEAAFWVFWRFFRAYLFRLGLLDGHPGFYIAASTFYSSLVRHTRLLEYGLSKNLLPQKP